MSRRTLTWGATLLVLAGCRHAPVDAPATGASSFTVIEARRAPAEGGVIVGEVGEPSAGKYAEDFQQARPQPPLVLPLYPPKALKAKAGRATVGVQVAVDADGRVSGISPSLLTFSTPGPYAEDFLESVKLAVRQWRFRPAELLQMESVQSGEFVYQRIARRSKTEAKLDLAFTFTATGGVEQGK